MTFDVFKGRSAIEVVKRTPPDPRLASAMTSPAGYIASTPGDGSLAAVTRQMDGSFKVVTNTKFTESLYALAVVDYDGDGKKDVATLSGSGKLQLHRGLGDATLQILHDYARKTGIPLIEGLVYCQEISSNVVIQDRKSVV